MTYQNEDKLNNNFKKYAIKSNNGCYNSSGNSGGFINNLSINLNSAIVESINLAGLNANYVGYYSALFDGRYIYFCPSTNSSGDHGYFARYDTTAAFTTGNVDVMNLVSIDAGYKGFRGMGFDGRYVYLGTDDTSDILRYDTYGTFTTGNVSAIDMSGVDATVIGLETFVFDGVYMYFISSNNNGRVCRYDPRDAFNNSNVDITNVQSFDSSYRRFRSACFDGRYIYMLSENDGTDDAGKIVRYDTTLSFSSSGSYDDVDLTSVNSEYKLFHEILFTGNEIYVLHANNNSAKNAFLKYDISNDFLATSFEIVDIQSFNNNYHNLKSGCFDGNNIYMLTFPNPDIPQEQPSDESSDYAQACICDNNGDLIVVGHSDAASTWDGETITNSTKKSVYITKYHAGKIGWEKSWTRIISKIEDINTSENTIAVDDDNNVYVTYFELDGFNTVKLYLSKIANDNSSISEITVTTAVTDMGDYCPIIYHDGYIITAVHNTTTNDCEIYRFNTSLSQQEKYNLNYDQGVEPRQMISDGSYFMIGGYQETPGSDAWALYKFYLNGSDNITELWNKHGKDSSVSNLNDIIFDYYIMNGENSGVNYIVKDEDGQGLFNNDNVVFLTSYGIFDGSTSKLSLPKTNIYTPSGSNDFRYEMEFDLDTTAADNGLFSIYEDGSNYIGLYFETANKRLRFVDTKNSLAIDSNNNTVTLTTTNYKVRVSRISGTGTIEIDEAGGGYSDETASTSGMANSLTVFDEEFQIGKYEGASTSFLDGRVYECSVWTTSNAGSFTANELVLKLDPGTDSLSDLFVNTEKGWVKRLTPVSDNIYFNTIADGTTHVYVAGEVSGVWETGYSGSASRLDLGAFSIQKSDGTISWKKQNGYSGTAVDQDGYIRKMVYDSVNNKYYCCGFSKGQLPNATHPDQDNTLTTTIFGLDPTDGDWAGKGATQEIVSYNNIRRQDSNDAYSILSLSDLNALYVGYIGMIYANKYLYLIPHENNTNYHGNVLRIKVKP